MKLRLLLLCLSLVANASAQKKSIIIKFCPIAMMDFVSFPTIQGGIEFPISEKISLYNEIGVQYIYPLDNGIDTNVVHDHGYKFKTEIRYNFQTSEKKHCSKRFLRRSECLLHSPGL